MLIKGSGFQRVNWREKTSIWWREEAVIREGGDKLVARKRTCHPALNVGWLPKTIDYRCGGSPICQRWSTKEKKRKKRRKQQTAQGAVKFHVRLTVLVLRRLPGDEGKVVETSAGGKKDPRRKGREGPSSRGWRDWDQPPR